MDSRTFTCTGAGGVRLIGDDYGELDAPPVLLLHGGGQTRHAWAGTARRLARAGHRAVVFDHRGHGDSQWAPDGDYGLEAFAGDLIAAVGAIGGDVTVVGASLGGLAGMIAEGERGPVMRALILVDVATRLEWEGVMRILSFMESGLDGFPSLEAAAEAIARYLPHREKPRDLSGLAKNLRQRDDGLWHWHWDPKFVRRSGADDAFSHQRLCDAARALRLPTLLVRGRMSDVVSLESVAEFRALVPHAAYADVGGATHMVAGDDNDAFTAAVLDFLRSLDRAPASTAL